LEEKDVAIDQIESVVCEGPVAAELVERLTALAGAQRLGPGSDPETTMGRR
jgi:acyl-CoA reductase-like NAD-dependent aldehyde dehydrogenase